MDERLAALDRRVAEAADAWLADSRDTGVYTRLVSAIEARRAYLHPLLELGQRPDDPMPIPARLQNDELLDQPGDAEPTAVRDQLHGDVREVLDTLRGSAPGSVSSSAVSAGAVIVGEERTEPAGGGSP